MNQDRDVQILRNDSRSYPDGLSEGYYNIFRFLNLNEQNILHMLPKDRLFTRIVSLAAMKWQSVRWRHLSLMLLFALR